ncbi:hypothetical protein C8Q77DRAFT_1129987 [Trametes polyzona]|nr:hypothetical protein C8Q77DRAFT_1129987 [Trametes polyzona]
MPPMPPIAASNLSLPTPHRDGISPAPSTMSSVGLAARQQAGIPQHCLTIGPVDSQVGRRSAQVAVTETRMRMALMTIVRKT